MYSLAMHRKEKEFDFPHKRAALMVLPVARFWELCPFDEQPPLPVKKPA